MPEGRCPPETMCRRCRGAGPAWALATAPGPGPPSPQPPAAGAAPAGHTSSAWRSKFGQGILQHFLERGFLQLLLHRR